MKNNLSVNDVSVEFRSQVQQPKANSPTVQRHLH